MTSFLLTAGLFVTSDFVKADSHGEFNFIPRIIVFQGNVFINGKRINEYETDITDGITLIAKSGDIELTTEVGSFTAGRYHIQLGPNLDENSTFEVWLENQVKAEESLFYGADSNGKWSLSVIQDQGFDYDTTAYNYFENILDINFNYKNLFFYTQLEYSDPPVYGINRTSINNLANTYFIEYSYSDWLLKYGHIQTLYGYGLDVNIFQDQVTDFDNRVKGL